MIKVREEQAADVAAIHRVNDEAFGQTGEAELVDTLREYDVSAEFFMVAELRDGALREHRGTVYYRPEFREVS